MFKKYRNTEEINIKEATHLSDKEKEEEFLKINEFNSTFYERVLVLVKKKITKYLEQIHIMPEDRRVIIVTKILYENDPIYMHFIYAPPKQNDKNPF